MQKDTKLDLPLKIQQRFENTFFRACENNGALQILIQRNGIQQMFKDDRQKNCKLYEYLYLHWVYKGNLKNAWKIRDQMLQLKFLFPKAPKNKVFLSKCQQPNHKNQQTRIIEKESNYSDNCLQQRINNIIEKQIQQAKYQIQQHLQANLLKFNQQYKLLSSNFQQRLQLRFSRADLEIQNLQQKLVHTNKKLIIESQRQISCLKGYIETISQNMKQLQKKLQDSSYFNDNITYQLQVLSNEFHQRVKYSNERFNEVQKINQAFQQNVKQIFCRLKKQNDFLQQTSNKKQKHLVSHHSIRRNTRKKNQNKFQKNNPYYNPNKFWEDSIISDLSTDLRQEYEEQFYQIQSQPTIFDRSHRKSPQFLLQVYQQGINDKSSKPMLNQKFLIKQQFPINDNL